MKDLIERYNDVCKLTKTGWWSINFEDKTITLDDYLSNIFHLTGNEIQLHKFSNYIIPEERTFFLMAMKLLNYNIVEPGYNLHFKVGTDLFQACMVVDKIVSDSEGHKVSEASGVIRVNPDTQEFSGSLLNLILEHIPMYFFIKDVKNDSKYVYCSPMMKTLFRQHGEDPVGRTDFELFGELEIANFFRKKDLEVYETGLPQHYTEDVIDSDGNKRVMDTIKVLLKREGKAPYILGLAWDLTYQKKIESLLCESNTRVHMACKAGSIYPWSWNMDEKTVELIYVEDGKTITRKVTYDSFLDYIHPDDIAEFTRTIREFINSNKNNIKLIARCRCFTPEYEWYEVTGNVYYNNTHTRRSKALGIMRNINEHKQHEEILKESDRMKAAFLASMSHEIRTPLNSIIGFSSLLSQTESKEEQAEYAKIIETNNNLLLRLINDMLDIAKFDSGRPDFHFDEFSLEEVFVTNQYIFQNQSKPGVKVVFEKQKEEYIIVSDRARISQVLNNLLTNAVKFTEKGTIRFGYKPTEDGIFVYVNDTGCGIPTHLQSLIFDRFMKVQDFSQGVGLGLSVCKTIIDLLKGEIGVRSEEENGSIFWFRIPCEKTAVTSLMQYEDATA